MCGILGSIGNSNNNEFIKKGLRRLRYRGYDSCGYASIYNDEFLINKTLRDQKDLIDITGDPVIAHTRWATHGKATLINCHPIKSILGDVVVVHNGTITNYADIDRRYGFERVTDTDTETIANLLQSAILTYGLRWEAIIKHLMQVLEGQYAVAFLCNYATNNLFCFTKEMPLLVSPDGYIASDSVAFDGFTDKYIRLADNDIIIMDRSHKFNIINNNLKVTRSTFQTNKIVEQEKDQHYMWAEIERQPQYIKDKTIKVGSFDFNKSTDKIVLLGCGSSYYASMIGKKYLESIAGISTEIIYASEFYNQIYLYNDRTLFIAISQSGETKDTIDAAKRVLNNGGRLAVICNHPESTLCSLTNEIILTNCGNEQGVAATISFTGQVLALYIVSCLICFYKPHNRSALSDAIQYLIECKLDHVIKIINNYTHFLIFGTNYNYPVALEAALKFKEVAYIHAEAMPAAEVKHGPLALIDKDVLSIFIITELEHLDSIKSNIQEVVARNGKILLVTNSQTSEELRDLHNNISYEIYLGLDQGIIFNPILATILFQILSYKLSVYKGINPDQPRHLAKSVTV